jgi:type IV pilus assembly protein PilB
MADTRLRLGQLLVDARMLTQQALDEVLVLQRSDGRRLGALLVEQRLINETQLTQILSHQLSVPWVSLLHVEFSRQLLNLVPHDVAAKYCLVPIYVRHVRGQGDTLYVAMNDPTNEEALSECASYSGLPARAMIAPPSDIVNAIRVYYGGGTPQPSTPTPVPPATVPTDSPRARRSERPPRSRPPPSAEAPPVEASESAPPAASSTPPAASSTPPLAARSAPPEASEEGLEAPLALIRALRAESDEDGPSIEAVELAPRMKAPVIDPGGEDEVPLPAPKGGTPRMVSLTLLDGTTITLPARDKKKKSDPPSWPSEELRALPPPQERLAEEGALTARDLVAALRAVAHGADATEILGSNTRWETMFAALLSLLLKKHLIADWEFVDEYKKV